VRRDVEPVPGVHAEGRPSTFGFVRACIFLTVRMRQARLTPAALASFLDFATIGLGPAADRPLTTHDTLSFKKEVAYQRSSHKRSRPWRL